MMRVISHVATVATAGQPKLAGLTASQVSHVDEYDHKGGRMGRKEALGKNRIIWSDPLASPRHAGRRPGIHVLQCWTRKRRGCRAFARHDDLTPAMPNLEQLFIRGS